MRARAHPTATRRGVISVVAMVCLIVVVMICGALLRQGIAGRRVVRSEERRLQAEWLAEAGLRRASARLASDRNYAGESWTLSADDLGGPDPGLVTIAVEAPKDRPDRRVLTVRAEYPAGAEGRAVRQSKRLVVALPASDESKDEKGKTKEEPTKGDGEAP